MRKNRTKIGSFFYIQVSLVDSKQRVTFIIFVGRKIIIYVWGSSSSSSSSRKKQPSTLLFHLFIFFALCTLIFYVLHLLKTCFYKTCLECVYNMDCCTLIYARFFFNRLSCSFLKLKTSLLIPDVLRVFSKRPIIEKKRKQKNQFLVE